MTPPNAYLLAADNSPALIPLLQSDSSLASKQDPHGYSLLHAAASYNHNELSRRLVREFGVNVDIKDEDGESPLFSLEHVEAAKVLVEELGADIKLRNSEGLTAREKITEDGDFPLVAAYLLDREQSGTQPPTGLADHAEVANTSQKEPSLPNGVSINVGAIEESEVVEEVVDPALKARIEQLAQRSDFEGQESQQELRDLITHAIRDHVAGDSNDRGSRR